MNFIPLSLFFMKLYDFFYMAIKEFEESLLPHLTLHRTSAQVYPPPASFPLYNPFQIIPNLPATTTATTSTATVFSVQIQKLIIVILVLVAVVVILILLGVHQHGGNSVVAAIYF